MNNMPNIKISDELKLVTDENLINKFLEEMPYKKYVDIIFTKLLVVYSYKDYYIAVMAHTDSYALRYAYEMVVFTADGSGHCVGHPKDDSELEFDLTPHIIDDQFIRTIKRNQKSESFSPTMSIKQLNEELEKFLEEEVKQYKHLDFLNTTKYSIKFNDGFFYDDLYTEEQIKDIFKKSEEMVDILLHINNKNNKDDRNLSYVPISLMPYGKHHTQYWGVDEVGNTVSTREEKQAIYGIGLSHHYSKKNWIFLEFYNDYTDKPKWETTTSLDHLIGYGTPNTIASYEQFLQIYNEFKKEYKKYYDTNYNALSEIENAEVYL